MPLSLFDSIRILLAVVVDMMCHKKRYFKVQMINKEFFKCRHPVPRAEFFLAIAIFRSLKRIKRVHKGSRPAS